MKFSTGWWGEFPGKIFPYEHKRAPRGKNHENAAAGCCDEKPTKQNYEKKTTPEFTFY